MFKSNSGLHGHFTKLIELVNSNERLHYVDVAVKLNVSPQTAQRYLLMLSKMYPDHLQYHKGTIYRKSLIGVDNVPLEHKVEMIKSRLDVLEDKLRTVKQALTSLIERENCSIDEVKAELKKMLEMI